MPHNSRCSAGEANRPAKAVFPEVQPHDLIFLKPFMAIGGIPADLRAMARPPGSKRCARRCLRASCRSDMLIDAWLCAAELEAPGRWSGNNQSATALSSATSMQGYLDEK
jgi:hypothetical protein